MLTNPRSATMSPRRRKAMVFMRVSDVTALDKAQQKNLYVKHVDVIVYAPAHVSPRGILWHLRSVNALLRRHHCYCPARCLHTHHQDVPLPHCQRAHLVTRRVRWMVCCHGDSCHMMRTTSSRLPHHLLCMEGFICCVCLVSVASIMRNADNLETGEI